MLHTWDYPFPRSHFFYRKVVHTVHLLDDHFVKVYSVVSLYDGYARFMAADGRFGLTSEWMVDGFPKPLHPREPPGACETLY